MLLVAIPLRQLRKLSERDRRRTTEKGKIEVEWTYIDDGDLGSHDE